MTEHTAERRGRLVGGYLPALGAALGLGTAMALARIAYQGGTDALAIAATRSIVVVVLMAAICLATGRSLRLPAPLRLHALGLGFTVAYMFYGNIAAVKYIPVGLAALLFFTYPPLVAVLMALFDRRPPGVVKSASLIAAFAGLCLMLGVSFAGLDGRGVALSLSTGAVCAWNAVWIGRRMIRVDAIVLTLHMSAVAALLLWLAVLLTGAAAPPVTALGWSVGLGIVAIQACSLPLYFIAIPRIGAEASAMLTNLQPVTAIAAAYLLFAEALAPVQFLGGAMVLGGIVAMQWDDARRHRRAAIPDQA